MNVLTDKGVLMVLGVVSSKESTEEDLVSDSRKAQEDVAALLVMSARYQEMFSDAVTVCNLLASVSHHLSLSDAQLAASIADKFVKPEPQP